ncbi:MAG: hypothetical protein ISR73_00800 [Gammaproteobacteria bacterium]|nr:hypothetical protein [Gammaproteobacteria bacterium]
MKGLSIIFGLWLLTQNVFASGDWVFASRTPVTAQASVAVFHHLEGAGRKHIALSQQTLAVVWEDDHSGSPQIYITYKALAGERFSAEQSVSSGTEAYEPAVTGLSGNRFAMTWEQDGAVFLRSAYDQQLSPALKLSEAAGSHASIASFANSAYVVWREQRATGWSLWVAVIAVAADGQLTLTGKNRIEAEDIASTLLFPAIAANSTGLVVAWEDRRAGHTRLNYSFSHNHGAAFSPPKYLNEFYSNRNQYDKGSGVTRVALSSYAQNEFLAAWMDKRRGNNGYGIFAAQAYDGSFGPDEKVHSAQGDELAHNNPATSGNARGDFVVVWDDFRAGNSDIWISRYTEDSVWSEDISPAPASGSGEQTHAAVALDEEGGLHLLWIERETVDAPSRLWYSLGSMRE